MCTNPIGSYHLLYHRFGKMSMYKLHKISQRFLCRIPIDSKQGAPGPSARLCVTIHVYPYPGTPTPIPMVPHTYIHTCIDTFVYLFIYLIVFVFVYLIVFCLSYSSLLSCSVSSRSRLASLTRPTLGQRQQVLSLLCVSMFYFI